MSERIPRPWVASMIARLANLRAHPVVFKHLTGLTVAVFDELAAHVAPVCSRFGFLRSAANPAAGVDDQQIPFIHSRDRLRSREITHPQSPELDIQRTCDRCAAN